MFQYTVVALCALLLLPAGAFAQFKPMSKAAQTNAKMLKAAVERATLCRVQGRPVVSSFVPKEFVKEERIGVMGAQRPLQATAANASFLYMLQNNPRVPAHEVGARFLLGHTGQPPAGKAYYTSQTELAQNLNTFYRGQGVVRRGPDGRNVKLYSLPVDGILYKPVGFQHALVLAGEDYFVIYDMENKSGRLVENTPQMRQLFSREGDSGTFDEVVSFDEKTFHIAIGEPAPQAEPTPQENYGDFEEVK